MKLASPNAKGHGALTAPPATAASGNLLLKLVLPRAATLPGTAEESLLMVFRLLLIGVFVMGLLLEEAAGTGAGVKAPAAPPQAASAAVAPAAAPVAPPPPPPPPPAAAAAVQQLALEASPVPSRPAVKLLLLLVVLFLLSPAGALASGNLLVKDLNLRPPAGPVATAPPAGMRAVAGKDLAEALLLLDEPSAMTTGDAAAMGAATVAGG